LSCIDLGYWTQSGSIHFNERMLESGEKEDDERGGCQ